MAMYDPVLVRMPAEQRTPLTPFVSPWSPNRIVSLEDDFRVVPATTLALRDAAYRVRFKVYCDELGWERASDFPDGRETDVFEASAQHCLVTHAASSAVAGCVRVLSPAPATANRLPFESVSQTDLSGTAFDPDVIGRGRIAEVSRFTLIAAYRRSQRTACDPDTVSWRTAPATLLALAGLAMVIKRNAAIAFAMMEPRLARQLRMVGICFEQVGALVEHRGARALFALDVASAWNLLSPECRIDLARILAALPSDSSAAAC
ncbi:MAG: PEP-CTERM/exosortase system-associated acyltransferase [Gemmatimonadota bacterium]|nr:PEP-CTERM/exosortase system-associated acyltransferase [Gemmatimonadota bacterium]